MKKIITFAIPALLAAAAFAPLAQADTMMTTTSAMMDNSNAMMAPSSDLSYGSMGDDVVTLQTWLVKGGFLTIPAGVSMGYFGPLTQAALISYQTSVGLPAHGYFGALTRAKINGTMAMMSSGSTSMTASSSDSMHMMPASTTMH